MKYKLEAMCHHITSDKYHLSFKDQDGNIIEAVTDKENIRQIIGNLDNAII